MLSSQPSIQPSFAVNKQGLCTIPLQRKKHASETLSTGLANVLSVRLREGYTIKDACLIKSKNNSLGGGGLSMRLANVVSVRLREGYTIKDACLVKSTNNSLGGGGLANILSVRLREGYTIKDACLIKSKNNSGGGGGEGGGSVHRAGQCAVCQALGGVYHQGRVPHQE